MKIQSREERIYTHYLASFAISRSGVGPVDLLMTVDKASEVEEFYAIAVGAADGKDETDVYAPRDKSKVIELVDKACDR